MTRKSWHTMTVDENLKSLKSDVKGITQEEAGVRFEAAGPNRLKEEVRAGMGSILFRQFTDVMIIILLVAAGIAWWMGDLTDTVMILVIVALNAALGFSQEYRAERALQALKRLEQHRVVVRRGGKPVEVAADEVVPGDIMALEEGRRVPADGRVIEETRMKVDEAHLTGESVPVEKHTRTLHEKAIPLGDRANMVFMGTTVQAGHGWAVVTDTGMSTELGKIAHLLQVVETRLTPLQLRLAYLGKWLALAALIMTGVIFAAGLLRGEPVEVMLLTAISLAVAVIPEGLPAVVTIVLALGAERMVRRNALVRKLPAVETLGCVTTICSDKTGTLTQNVMSAEILYMYGRLIDITGNGYKPEGQFIEKGKKLNPGNDEDLLKILRVAGLCTNAALRKEKERWVVLGDPTEGALVVASEKGGMHKDVLDKEFPRIDEIPFDSNRKLMTTIHRDSAGGGWAFTKGSPEEVLRCSTSVLQGGEDQPLTRHRNDEINRIHREMARDGIRVLACAAKSIKGGWAPEAKEDPEKDLVFLGLFGLMDPPRPEVRAAVSKCRQAGIRPIMITGDHRITAEAIARNLEIEQDSDSVLSGEEMEGFGESTYRDSVKRASVFARVSPEHKVKIVHALKANGEIVSMTGDGVNDAPALRAADIGVAMGKTGTDVAREAAEIVLLDDNFATIVSAVEEGRIIYDNIRKFTRYMLSTNSGEILTMFFAILFGLPLPLLPIQILWINLVTDGLPALALGVEPPERGIMRRPPRAPDESIFAGGLGFHILWVGFWMGGITIALFGWAQEAGDLVRSQTMAFFALTMFQMFHVMAIRSEREALWTIGLFSNTKLFAAVILAVVLQVGITYLSPLQAIFHTASLSLNDLGLCTLLPASLYAAVELEKRLLFRWKKDLKGNAVSLR